MIHFWFFLLVSLAMLAPSKLAVAAGTATTSYWYGGALHPLVVTRDGVDYRLIGKGIVEEVGSSPSPSYLQADRLGSVRMVTDDRGNVAQSLGYDDYGLTHIAGESSAATDDSMASFYRFQGQEQETFPLSKLGIQDAAALASWLDAIQLYHFPWRDYAAGFAVFTETDPIPIEDSLYAALGANPVNFTDETGGIIGTLANIDRDTRALLNRMELGDELLLAERRQLQELLRRVELETFGELESRFAIVRETRAMQFSWIRDMEISRARARIARERAGGSVIISEEEQFRIEHEAMASVDRNPSRRLANAAHELHFFVSDNDRWLNYYTGIREAWLGRYAGPIRLLSLADDRKDNEDDDEKASHESSESEEKDEKEDREQPDDELVPLAQPQDQGDVEQDTSSDEDVLIDMPTHGGGNGQDVHAPAVRPPREENRLFRCCNIL